MPHNLIFTTRDEITCADLAQVLYFQADGNYVKMFLSSGRTAMLLMSMQNVEQLLAHYEPHRFLRTDRSLIVNTRFLLQVSNAKQVIVLGDEQHPSAEISVSHKTLDVLHEALKKHPPLTDIQPHNGKMQIRQQSDTSHS